MPSLHVRIVELTDGRCILISYGVPVAAWIPRTFTACTCRADTRTGERQGSLLDDCPQHGERRLPDIAGWIKFARRYSVTTSRHVNQWVAYDHTHDHTIDSPEVWAQLVYPLIVRLER